MNRVSSLIVTLLVVIFASHANRVHANEKYFVTRIRDIGKKTADGAPELEVVCYVNRKDVKDLNLTQSEVDKITRHVVMAPWVALGNAVYEILNGKTAEADDDEDSEEESIAGDESLARKAKGLLKVGFYVEVYDLKNGEREDASRTRVYFEDKKLKTRNVDEIPM